MGYKLLGYIVWRVGKWWVARKVRAEQRKLVIGGAAAAGVTAVAVVAARSAGGE